LGVKKGNFGCLFYFLLLKSGVIARRKAQWNIWGVTPLVADLGKFVCRHSADVYEDGKRRGIQPFEPSQDRLAGGPAKDRSCPA
jgi:hypothetical protein